MASEPDSEDFEAVGLGISRHASCYMRANRGIRRHVKWVAAELADPILGLDEVVALRAGGESHFFFPFLYFGCPSATIYSCRDSRKIDIFS